MWPSSPFLYQVFRWLPLHKYETATVLVLPSLVEVVDVVEMFQLDSPIDANLDIVDEGAICTIARFFFFD